jgi:enamine deaminase RidA (YjgF/YER057c/UK114 family)
MRKALTPANLPASPPVSTLMSVGGFTDPEFKVEVEIVAAQQVPA